LRPIFYKYCFKNVEAAPVEEVPVEAPKEKKQKKGKKGKKGKKN